MKTSELSGVALDWAVAQCAGAAVTVIDDGITRCLLLSPSGRFAPSTHWSQGGPIIERELIRVIAPTVRGVDWVARIKQDLPSNMNGWIEKTGPTPLVAAMRCYVASKLGDDVEIPKELE